MAIFNFLTSKAESLDVNSILTGRWRKNSAIAIELEDFLSPTYNGF